MLPDIGTPGRGGDEPRAAGLPTPRNHSPFPVGEWAANSTDRPGSARAQRPLGRPDSASGLRSLERPGSASGRQGGAGDRPGSASGHPHSLWLADRPGSSLGSRDRPGSASGSRGRDAGFLASTSGRSPSPFRPASASSRRGSVADMLADGAYGLGGAYDSAGGAAYPYYGGSEAGDRYGESPRPGSRSGSRPSSRHSSRPPSRGGSGVSPRDFPRESDRLAVLEATLERERESRRHLESQLDLLQKMLSKQLVSRAPAPRRPWREEEEAEVRGGFQRRAAYDDAMRPLKPGGPVRGSRDAFSGEEILKERARARKAREEARRAGPAGLDSLTQNKNPSNIRIYGHKHTDTGINLIGAGLTGL